MSTSALNLGTVPIFVSAKMGLSLSLQAILIYLRPLYSFMELGLVKRARFPGRKTRNYSKINHGIKNSVLWQF
jgi:hypothetical protein